MSWEDLSGGGVRHSPSPLESARFGLGVARVVVGDDVPTAADAADDLTRILSTAPEPLLIVRYPARLAALGAAAAASNRRILPTDVLTYWEIPAGQLRLDETVAAADGCVVRVPERAGERELQALDAVVVDSFRGYGNHYTANPMLDAALALEGYREWATRSLRDNPADVVLLEQNSQVVGVATLEQSPDGDDLEILLAGLVGNAQGRGWYAHLLGGIGQVARQRGCARVVISTQVHNVRVQRAWARAGFKPYAAVTTLHAVATSLG